VGFQEHKHSEHKHSCKFFYSSVINVGKENLKHRSIILPQFRKKMLFKWDDSLKALQEELENVAVFRTTMVHRS
jgi:hypothetical protein